MRIARVLSELKRPPLWQTARILFSVSRRQAFLDRAGWMLQLSPADRKRPWALWILSLSPHYFIYQWTGRYRGKNRAEILNAESDRNTNSRRAICNGLLRGFLRNDMTVLDFGCGPGYLAKQVSQYVAKVRALDISRGTLDCARVINGAPNIEYIANGEPNLKIIQDSSIDFLYSIAVIQHLDKNTAASFLREFVRVLKPQATALCHFVATDTEARQSGPQMWFRLRATYYTRHEMEEMASRAGFSKVSVVPVREISDIDDDVGRQHVAVLVR